MSRNGFVRQMKITTGFAGKICDFMLCIFLFLQLLAFSQEARLTNIIVTNTRDDLLVYLTVEGAFNEKIKEAVLSGVSFSFSFFITLFRERNLWLDKEITDVKIIHRLKYDNLKKAFTIRRSWESGKPIITQSFEPPQKIG